jgi:hypothetical protein
MKEIFHPADCARPGRRSDPKRSQSRSALMESLRPAARCLSAQKHHAQGTASLHQRLVAELAGNKVRSCMI